MKPRRTLLIVAVLAVPLILALLAASFVLLSLQGGMAPFRVPEQGARPAATPAMIERGQYLATIGNCSGCHTARGGTPLAGGRAFRTTYGVVHSTNLTPHPQHGIGAWTAEEFRHAMRHGVSRNGVLSPVFPYASFRHLTDADLDALLAYLGTVPSSDTPRTGNALRFPASLPGAMAAWRLLYFRPAPQREQADPTLARGAYLVEGIGHCATGQASRGALASQAGGNQLWGARNAGWYAPPLHDAALSRFDQGDVAGYLRGAAPGGIGAYGLMADVVAGNLQYLTKEDAGAIEAYLRQLPPPPRGREPQLRRRATHESLAAGRDIYDRHCADCHGDRGEGEPGKYPPLRGSSAVAADDAVNLINLVLFGAVAPSTPLNPAPYTMPPFAQVLSASEVAAVVNVLRLQENEAAVPVDASGIQAVSGSARP
jgi:mono/diheme cytochrome c family protein